MWPSCIERITRMRSNIYIYTFLNIKNMSSNGISASDGSFLPRYSTFPVFYVLQPSLKFHTWWEWHRSRATTVKRCRSQRDEGRNRNLDPPEILPFCRSSPLHLSFNKLLPPRPIYRIHLHRRIIFANCRDFHSRVKLRTKYSRVRSILGGGGEKTKGNKRKKRISRNTG